MTVSVMGDSPSNTINKYICIGDDNNPLWVDPT